MDDDAIIGATTVGDLISAVAEAHPGWISEALSDQTSRSALWDTPVHAITHDPSSDIPITAELDPAFQQTLGIEAQSKLKLITSETQYMADFKLEITVGIKQGGEMKPMNFEVSNKTQFPAPQTDGDGGLSLSLGEEGFDVGSASEFAALAQDVFGLQGLKDQLDQLGHGVGDISFRIEEFDLAVPPKLNGTRGKTSFNATVIANLEKLEIADVVDDKIKLQQARVTINRPAQDEE
ncbi:hypothetical protein [Shimia ponticola]|uniref:hypothetical protein n=1 Tax=Shimia ponticola TaxID=2582893 RepID=UPI0011BDEB48|nr:hypothetical protein [Shimia ponticola]